MVLSHSKRWTGYWAVYYATVDAVYGPSIISKIIWLHIDTFGCNYTDLQNTIAVPWNPIQNYYWLSNFLKVFLLQASDHSDV